MIHATSVMTLDRRVMIFVGSSRPPRPTSITATLTFSFAKQQNASAVPNSNSVICTPSFSQASTAGHTLSTSAASLSPAIGSPVDADAPLFVHVAEVAAVEPAVVVERAIGALLGVEVAHELVRPARDLLALLAARHVVAVASTMRTSMPGKGMPDQSPVPFEVSSRGHGRCRGSFPSTRISRRA